MGLNPLLVGLVGLVFVTPVHAQQWAEFHPPDAKYSVEMPGEWTMTVNEVSTDVGSVKAHMATVTLGDRAYMTMYSAYPPEKVRGKAVTPILDGARDGAVGNVEGGKLRKEERLLISNLPARQIIVDTPSLMIVARMFMLDVFLIQALVAGPNGIDSEPTTMRFLNSLKVRYE